MQFESTVRITKPAISRFTEQVTEFLGSGGVDARATHHVSLILDEMLTNLATHGESAYEKAEVRISIEPEHVRGEIVDSGPPFDPRSTADPDLDKPIAERPVGGLGLFLVRQLTSGLDYARRDDRNCTSFTVPRSGAQGEQ
jgi:anti-sigma regulatory factor (Ser/Thr protein kinase)